MRRSWHLAVSLAFGAALGANTVRAQSASPAQGGSPAQGAQAEATPPAADEADVPLYPPPSTRWKMFGVGIGTTVAFYGAAVGLSVLYPDEPGFQDLRIPIVGPWMAVANNGCPADEPDCSEVFVVMRTLFGVLDGVAQAGGLAIAAEGLFMPTQVQAPLPNAPSFTPKAPSPSTPPPSTPTPSGSDKNLFLLPTPMTVGARGIGLGVVGRF
ncbi:MAG TPA: hypothetical protein VJT73_06680 [Polyangiaceae bacterium]|nr:hypothetical protein [Polyangiaceae bacterium]